MGARGVSSLPVTDPATGRLVGLIDRGHLLAAYEAALAGGGEAVQRGARPRRRRRPRNQPPASPEGVAPDSPSA
jgi:CBS domain-containing protein